MIPLLDLRAQYESIRDEIQAAINGVLESCQFALGREVAAFEKEFAAYCQADFAIGTSSGTSALHLALLAAEIGPGHEVITTPFTFVATVAAIQYAGATPVLVDIDPHAYTIDVSAIESAITDRTRAIMPVHLYGQCADMDPILGLAKARGLLVIEDAAQAHGAEYKGRRAGSMGDLAGFSFYPGKNLGAYGEGGAVTTNNPTYDRKIRMLRDWGAERKYEHELKGYNYRLDGIQGAVLRVKLRRLDEWTRRRQQLASRYDELFADSRVTTPAVMPYSTHVYHQYTLRVKQRASLQHTLLEDGIMTGIHYPVPVHRQEAYADLGYAHGSFPVAETLAEECLSLPIFPELTDEQVGYIVAAVKKHAA